MIECGDILVLRRITKQQCLRNPEKSEFLLRSDTDNMMMVFPNGQRDLVRVGSGMGPVPQNITLDNLFFIESLSNWYRQIGMAPGTLTVSNLCTEYFMLNSHCTFSIFNNISIFNSQFSHQPSPIQLIGQKN